MKKITSVILICLYTLSITGIAINKFYCCGKLESVSIAASSPELANCKIPVKKDGCCDQSSKTFKVKDQHLVSGSILPLNLSITGIINLFYLCDPVSSSQKEIAAFNYHAPPVFSDTSIHSLNCTYRI